MKKRILIFYDHFYPAWKAGGPVQSLVNLVRALCNEYDFYVVCKPHEMNETATLPGVVINEWNEWEEVKDKVEDKVEVKAKLYYWRYGRKQRTELKQLLQEVAPSMVYVNGLYSLYFNILPVHYAIDYCRQQQDCKLILSARGMLHPGALSQKALKKKLFLSLFRLMGWPKHLQWHATDEQEQRYIHQQFGSKLRVTVAGNFPDFLPVTAGPFKNEGELIMGTVALISPMKNHLAVLQALQKSTASIQWHIYGPVKDAAYWKECEAMIAMLPPAIKVVYHGELSPADKVKAMEQFQVFIMPSKSENFGHALLEALSAGKPVITTDTTPFKDLQHVKAGFTVAINRLQDDLSLAIAAYAAMNTAELAEHSKAAAALGANFVDVEMIKTQYRVLF